MAPFFTLHEKVLNVLKVFKDLSLFMNTFGSNFRFTSFGESHGVVVGGVVDGCPAGLSVDFDMIDRDLARRRGDGLSGTTARKEADKVEWLSGLLDGVTLGTPIAFAISFCGIPLSLMAARSLIWISLNSISHLPV